MTRKELYTALILGSLVAIGGRPLIAQTAESQPVAPDGAPPPYPGSDGDGFKPDQEPPAAVPTDDQLTATAPEVFHRELPPEAGTWQASQHNGEVWVPHESNGWRPYTAGHWTESDQGMAWIDDAPWGWATYHYGRWYYDANLGWAWVPGAVWAPSWVAWRDGGGYIGWAPLPPTVGFAGDQGLDGVTATISPGMFTFVAEKDILAPRVASLIVPTARNQGIVTVTADVTRYSVAGNRVISGGLSAARLSRAVGYTVSAMPVAGSSSLGGHGARGPFYQPAALSRVARSSHREFGRSLQHQLAVVHSNASLRTGASGTSQHPPSGSRPGGRSAQNNPLHPLPPPNSHGPNGGSPQGRYPPQQGPRTPQGQKAPPAQGQGQGQKAPPPQGQKVPPGQQGQRPPHGG